MSTAKYSEVFESGLLNEAALGFEDFDPPAGTPAWRTVACHFANGRWQEPFVTELPYTPMNRDGDPLPRSANTYGQNFFEAFCAHATRDGQCLIFRWNDHALRAESSAKLLKMEPLPAALFHDMHAEAVRQNASYLPRHGTGGRLYLRLKAQSTGRQLKLGPSPSYVYEVFARPVGNYFASGVAPKRLYSSSEYDRVAERSIGRAKAGGLYAAAYIPQEVAGENGCDEFLFRDASTRTRVLETGCSNLIVLRADMTYITPNEPAVLQSITNLSLQTIVRELMGFNVEVRRLPLWREAFENHLRRGKLPRQPSQRQLLEAGLCGTAARLAPVASILFHETDGREHTIAFPNTGEFGGPWCTELREHLIAIQHGDETDRWSWTEEVRL